MTDGARAYDPASRSNSPIAEEIRIRLANAWGEMGAAWGVAPAIARVHAYLMARQEPLTEREVREALGLSHRAASLALAEAESWGLVERVAEPRRVGRRGPGRHGLHGDRRPLAMVRSRGRRAQGPRGRPDHHRPRADADRHQRRDPAAPRRRRPHAAARLADDLPRVRPAVRPRGRAWSAAWSRPSSSGPCGCWARCPTSRSCAWSSCSTACRTTTCWASSRRSAACRRRPRGARPR